MNLIGAVDGNTNVMHHTGDFRAQEMQEKAILEVAVCINLEAWHLASNCWHLASNFWLWKGVGGGNYWSLPDLQVSVESPAQPNRIQCSCKSKNQVNSL
jgi:hypothetical protein